MKRILSFRPICSLFHLSASILIYVKLLLISSKIIISYNSNPVADFKYYSVYFTNLTLYLLQLNCIKLYPIPSHRIALQAPVPRRETRRAGWSPSVPFRGCSPGRRRDSTCPHGWALVRQSQRYIQYSTVQYNTEL